jgi:orotidine 5'-phosphate decarboxylase subfamily 1
MGKRLSYLERAVHYPNALGQRLLLLMQEKQSNLAIAADVTRTQDLLDIAKKLGPEICMLKTHVDILTDVRAKDLEALRRIADERQFLLFEDRKFADIGSIVKAQYLGGLYQIANWAHLVTVHSIAGADVLKGFAEAMAEREAGVLLLAQLSSAGNLMNEQYIDSTMRMAKQYPQVVTGLIAQTRQASGRDFIYCSPGVSLRQSSDDLGQRYRSPQQAIIDQGADVVIVGRDILTHDDPTAYAKEIREMAWQAYCQTVK